MDGPKIFVLRAGCCSESWVGEPSEHWQPEVKAEVIPGSGALNDLAVRFDQPLKASAVQPHRDAAGQRSPGDGVRGESSSLEPSVLL